MVALLSHLIQSFRCLLSSFSTSVPLLASLSTNHSSLVHALGIPLPQVMHKILDKEFVEKFDEVLVIGDIHGCYDELIQLLAQINDNAKDGNEDSNNNQQNESNRILKLFVGDLVNKGPKSSEVIDFMMNNSESCLSVRGNHDEVVIKQYLLFESGGESALKEKNLWMKFLSRKQIDYLISMPYTISIPSLNALVVHAGIVPNVELNHQNITNLIEMRNLISDQSNGNLKGKLTATSSHSKGEPWVKKWLGPQHIYFGHDAKRRLQRTHFCTGLDTGCVYGNFLSAIFIAGPRKGSLVSVKAKAVHSPPKVNPSN